MVEIISLLVFLDRMGAIARRRGRSPNLFQLMLVGFWFGGEIVAGFLAGIAAGTRGWGDWTLLIIYAVALAGAAVGATCAILIARSVSPVGGVFHDLREQPIRRSRLAGALVGGIVAGALGVVFAIILTRSNRDEDAFERIILPILVVLVLAAIGTLLGLASGLQKKTKET